MNKSDKCINLLWTGGWDSTFQLLQAALKYHSKVQPYYIIDPNRKSIANELMAMRKIKSALFNSFPEAKELILPIIFCKVDDVEIDEDIEKAFLNFKKEKHIGIQYLWLASYCKKNMISDMQLSIEKSLLPDPNLWDANLEGKLVEKKLNNQVVEYMDSSFKGSKEYEIFQYFAFPLMQTTKQEMLEIAREKDWFQIIEQSWFCLFPTHKNEPCGICKPCTQTISDGFAFRMPKNRRLFAAYVNKFEIPVKTMAKKILQGFGLFKKQDGHFIDYPITPEPNNSSSRYQATN
ncbi:7-cyano-7-deazaguanine synthase [Lutimonas halocynthiae]|uniref:7-cyano-7-deazaguanine synthase n=1 Tax=Lutimonas halocynthiae TaxID=1446477 RepID=UPI0025B369BD|nr:7-cyano-7-deazaguanine synthase [Lutimonas halocynthiae]MDN3644279.1 7-cyano-7-deazaguanine synthase [Lutimonas halocynthiae]